MQYLELTYTDKLFVVYPEVHIWLGTLYVYSLNLTFLGNKNQAQLENHCLEDTSNWRHSLEAWGFSSGTGAVNLSTWEK